MAKWQIPSELFNAPGMDHIITVRGKKREGRSQHGKPVKDRTEEIRNWISDNNFVYTAIYQHVKTCDVCSAEIVLQAYLSKREHNNAGRTSATLSDFALKLERLQLPTGRGANPETVDEIVCKSGSAEAVKSRWERLSTRRKVQAMEAVNTSISRGITEEMHAYSSHGEWLKGGGLRRGARKPGGGHQGPPPVRPGVSSFAISARMSP